ncbi:MAG: EthD domain-containing protein [Actinomycetota bacterium]
MQRIRFNVLEADAPYDGIAELWFESAEAADAAYATVIGKAVADSMAHVSSRVRMLADEHEVLG